MSNTVTQYDLLGRATDISYNDGTPAKHFYYDRDDPAGGWSTAATNAKGRLAGMRTDANTRAQFMYDVAGNVVSMQQCTPATCGTNNQQTRGLGFGYDLANTLNFEQDPASGGISYGLSVAEEVTSVTNQTYTGTYNPANIVSNVVNGPTGSTSYTLGNGLSVYNLHDNSGRLNGRWLCTGAAAFNCSTQIYVTDVFLHGSRVTGSDDTVLPGYAAYGYDDLNRLASVNRTIGNQTVFAYTYSYDRYGNRLAQTQTGGNSRPSSTQNFAFSNHITSPGYSYDSAGNVASDGAHSDLYDGEGNVIGVDGGNNARYTYDALNRRVAEQLQNSSSSTEYIYDAFGRRTSSWAMPQNFGVEGRIYMNGSLLAYRSIGGTTVYSSQDILGTERMRTNYAGKVLDTFKSLPFGDGYTYGTGNGGSAAYQENLQFSELEHDAETQTEHATYRQYSSFDGRWMSPDPYDGSYDPSNPQSFNRYAYVNNNPGSMKDPSGLLAPGCDASCQNFFFLSWWLNEYFGPYYAAALFGQQLGVTQSSSSNASTSTKTTTPPPPAPAPSKKACAGMTPPSGPINYSQSAANNAKMGLFGWYQAFKGGGAQDFKGNAAFGSPANQVAAGDWNFGASVAAKGWSLSTAMALAGAGAFLSNVNAQAGYAMSQAAYMQGQYGGPSAPNAGAPGPQWNMGPGFPGFPSSSGNQGDQVAPNENQAVISGYVWYAMGCHS